MKLRIAYVINMIHPYQEPVFERLARRDDCELLVVFETERERNREWQVPRELGFDHVVLETRSLDLARYSVGSGVRLVSDIYVHVPRRPLAPIRRFAPHAVVAGGGGVWASPTNIASLLGRRRGGWAFVPRWESFRRERPTLPRRIAEPWVRRFIRSGDAWIAIGRRSADDLVSLGADRGRIAIAPIVPVPVRPELLRDPAARTEGVTRFLFVGQLIPRKAVDVLLAAFARVPGAELVIVGSGPLAEEVRAAAARDGRVTVHPHLGLEELASAYRAADAFVLPSQYEVWGLVVHEALTHGLPVVVTDKVGAATDLVRHGENGIVVPDGSVEALADAMRAVAAWPQERRLRGAAVSREQLRSVTHEAAVEGTLRAAALAWEHRVRRVAGAA